MGRSDAVLQHVGQLFTMVVWKLLRAQVCLWQWTDEGGKGVCWRTSKRQGYSRPYPN